MIATIPSGADTAGPADVEALVALVNGAYRGDSGRLGWTTEADLLGGQRADSAGIAELLADPNSVVIVMREGRQLAACVHLERLPGGVAYLGMLTVRPDAQRSGLGRQILAAAELHAQRHFGARAVEMTVIEARRELIAWYERRGYRLTGEFRPFPYGDSRFGLPLRDDLRFVVMRRSLAVDGPCDTRGSV
jgi:ribosomal protein S18 acetylase RimI-like enzyme